jgi:hypothetical protein
MAGPPIAAQRRSRAPNVSSTLLQLSTAKISSRDRIAAALRDQFVLLS